jgi:intraflagellar transport protein 52
LIQNSRLKLFISQVFPPTFRELPAPPLELFDLDEAFSSEISRMAQIANKCGENDLQYLISTAFEALGLQSANALTAKSEKEMLYAVALEIATFKKQAEMPIDFL